ncbi:hypothetical protein P6U16_01290 [Rhizobium sp. 32-5/1]|uniref:hypothetical protein n=1 Tax=Rhizobium sp. 32-5/1 TaxID=3019602 RepID=UPI00240D80A4|nr:hypothetical protein [Rhizobium sp. 32-5/1]WEZ83520.1 hypothetical protein P6U16_01290 [Rhizobium sp. 32-5/1]
MSAFFSVCYEDRIEILTDGAHYNPDGCLVALQTKIFPNGSKPFAVTGRGHSVSLERFARLFNRVADACVSVDDALREIDREIQKLGLMAIEKAPQPVEVIIPCISETKGPINVYLATQDVYGYAAPFTMSVAPSEVGGGRQCRVTSLRRTVLRQALRLKVCLRSALPSSNSCADKRAPTQQRRNCRRFTA